MGCLMPISGELATRLIQDANSLQALAGEWTRLWESCERLTSFQRPEWILPWVEIFQPHKLCVVEVRRDRQLYGLAPMFCYQRDGERVLAPLGAGITDYLDWLIHPEGATETILQILDCLAQCCEPWDRLDLPDLSESSLLAEHHELPCLERVSQQLCPALRLPEGLTDLRSAIPERQRKNLRTAHNRIQRAGAAQIEIANTHTLPEFLDALLHLHGIRWQNFGMPGVLSDERVQKFHERSAPALLRAGVLRFYGLRLDGELIAVLHTLCGRDTIYCYLQGFDPNYSFVSPGMQIIAASIEDAIRERKRVVDFLRGSEAYKYSWGARDRVTYRLQASRKDFARHCCERKAA
jgi:CelD/BcsL family acetyltransferase involved in cellulose biosynthesis